MVGDDDVRHAAALLDPRGDRFDRMGQRVGAGSRRNPRARRAARDCAGSGKIALASPRPMRASTSAAESHSASSHSPAWGRGGQSPSGARATKKQVSNRRACWNAGFQRANRVSASRSSESAVRCDEVGERLARRSARPGDRRRGRGRQRVRARPRCRFPRASRGSRRFSRRLRDDPPASAASLASIRPPGKTRAPPANAMPAARSTISRSGAAPAMSRTTTRVAAGIASRSIAARPRPARGAKKGRRPEGRRPFLIMPPEGGANYIALTAFAALTSASSIASSLFGAFGFKRIGLVAKSFGLGGVGGVGSHRVEVFSGVLVIFLDVLGRERRRPGHRKRRERAQQRQPARMKPSSYNTPLVAAFSGSKP